MSISINFNTIRSYNGSQNNAFEELCCQLAHYETVPRNSLFQRIAPPDAGVECYWTLPNGDELGWQAKFFLQVPDRGRWSQIDSSVKTALTKHPRLIRYTICLPIDRTGSARDDAKSFMDRWNEHVEKWNEEAAQKGISVSIIYWGRSEIVERLSRSEHRGRSLFWFNSEILDRKWFESRFNEVKADVGVRYTPEYNVNLPIAQLFECMARTPEFNNKVNNFSKNIKSSITHIHVFDKQTDEKYVVRIKETIYELLKYLDSINKNEMKPIDWNAIAEKSSIPQKEIGAYKSLLYDELRTAENRRKEKISYQLLGLDKIEEPIDELIDFLESDYTALSNLPSLLLVGNAGTGKTHLLSDIAKVRLERGYPTILLLGSHFADGEPWAQIRNKLDFSWSKEELLGALEAAAESSGVRAIIFIDALNEGSGKYIWEKHIGSFLETISNYPWIGLTVSVRTSYEDIIIPKGLVPQKMVRAEHNGFTEVEYEAINKFFSYFGIEKPSTPFLMQEFENPLFLKLFCQGLQNKGLTKAPQGYQGITTIFNFFIDSVNDKLWKPDYLDYDPKDHIIQKAIASFTKVLVEKGNSWLDREEARSIIDKVLPRESYEKSLFRALLSEGVIAEDVYYPNLNMREKKEVCRLAYERFSDHLVAKQLLTQYFSNENPFDSFLPGRALGNYVKDEYSCLIHSGIVEALTIQIPEICPHELAEIAPSTVEYSSMKTAFIESIVWRDPEAFNNFTDYYIEQHISQSNTLHDFLDALLMVAFNPNHRYNGDYLHSILIGQELADRDSWWSRYLHERYSTYGVTNRLVEWAWQYPPDAHIDDDKLLLLGTTLSWFLTTSNRFLRDRCTKALVALYSSRLPKLSKLLDRFEDVNDVYITERLYAVAYGCALRCLRTANVEELARKTYTKIFESGTPPEHLLLRDYARGIIEIAIKNNPTLDIDSVRIRPPYHSEWKNNSLPMEEIKAFAKYDSVGKLTIEERSRLHLYMSIFDDDFARYIIGTNGPFFDWYNIPIDDIATEYEPTKHRFDLNLIQRLIFTRVIELGWDADKFGEFDNYINSYNRDAHKAERIGKKYQWIAYYEILARIADNFRYVDRNGGGTYEGPWQLLRRDIDPSNILQKTMVKLSENTIRTWWSPITYDKWTDEAGNESWVSKTNDLPEIEPLLIVTQPPSNKEWLVLDASYHFNETDHISPQNKTFFYTIHSMIVKDKDFQRIAKWLKKDLTWDLAYRPYSHFYNIFFGELFRQPAYTWMTSESEGYSVWAPEYRNCPVDVLVTTNNYLQEAEYDCSIEESMTITIPSKMVHEEVNLKWGAMEGVFIDEAGNWACIDPSVYSCGPSALLIRKDTLTSVLKENDWHLIWVIQGEKNIFNPDFKRNENMWQHLLKVYYLEKGELSLLREYNSGLEKNK